MKMYIHVWAEKGKGGNVCKPIMCEQAPLLCKIDTAIIEYWQQQSDSFNYLLTMVLDPITGKYKSIDIEKDELFIANCKECGVFPNNTNTSSISLEDMFEEKENA